MTNRPTDLSTKIKVNSGMSRVSTVSMKFDICDADEKYTSKCNLAPTYTSRHPGLGSFHVLDIGNKREMRRSPYLL